MLLPQSRLLANSMVEEEKVEVEVETAAETTVAGGALVVATVAAEKAGLGEAMAEEKVEDSAGLAALVVLVIWVMAAVELREEGLAAGVVMAGMVGVARAAAEEDKVELEALVAAGKLFHTKIQATLWLTRRPH